MDEVIPVTGDTAPSEPRALRAVPPTRGPELHRVAELAQTLAGTHHTSDVVRATVPAVAHALDSAFVAVARLDEDQHSVAVLADSTSLVAPRTSVAPTAVHRLARQVLARALVDGEGTVRYAAGQASRHDTVEMLMGSAGVSTCMVTPIVVGGQVWGGVFATRCRGQRAFDAEDAALVVALAAVAGAGLAQLERIESLALLARTDAMTGLANRRGADAALDAALAVHRSTGVPVSVVLCDVNGLERINDLFGHAAGDLVLTRVAALLSVAVADVPGSTAARVGGDEFCLVLPGVPGAQVTELVERLAESARTLPFGAGVCCGHASTESCAENGDRVSARRLFRLADAAQYRAKRSGGVRRTVIGPEDVVDPGPTSRSGPAWSGSPPPRIPAGPDSVAEWVAAMVQTVDREADKSPLDRLIAVADAAGTWLRAAGWAVSTVDPGADVLLTRATASVRASAGGILARKLTQPGRTFSLDACALTAAAVRGGHFHVEIHDEAANEGALAMLADAGYTGMVAAGSTDPVTGTAWFLEIYGDAFTRPPDGTDEATLAATLRAILAFALYPGIAPAWSRGTA